MKNNTEKIKQIKRNEKTVMAANKEIIRLKKKISSLEKFVIKGRALINKQKSRL